MNSSVVIAYLTVTTRDAAPVQNKKVVELRKSSRPIKPVCVCPGLNGFGPCNCECDAVTLRLAREVWTLERIYRREREKRELSHV